MSELKKCPYCGDAWVYASVGDYGSGYDSDGYRINCRCGYAWKKLNRWFPSAEHAIYAWNRSRRYETTNI